MEKPIRTHRTIPSMGGNVGYSLNSHLSIAQIRAKYDNGIDDPLPDYLQDLINQSAFMLNPTTCNQSCY